jgi:ABC-type multidrug transport system fused ATPase/permease subunit
MVLEKGGIIQQGTHDELIHKNGLYKDIYDAQMFMEVGANA